MKNMHLQMNDESHEALISFSKEAKIEPSEYIRRALALMAHVQKSDCKLATVNNDGFIVEYLQVFGW